MTTDDSAEYEETTPRERPADEVEQSGEIGSNTGRSLWECRRCHTVKVGSDRPEHCHACDTGSIPELNKNPPSPLFKQVRL